MDNAYANVGVYDGKYLLIASMLFAIQIYCDFAGYSTIAIGAAEVMGFQLMDILIAHIYHSLSQSFGEDGIFHFLPGLRTIFIFRWVEIRKGKVRKYINIMIVFLVSGLWHGANCLMLPGVG